MPTVPPKDDGATVDPEQPDDQPTATEEPAAPSNGASEPDVTTFLVDPATTGTVITGGLGYKADDFAMVPAASQSDSAALLAQISAALPFQPRVWNALEDDD